MSMSTSPPFSLKLLAVLILAFFIFFFTFLPPKSVMLKKDESEGSYVVGDEKKKMVVGSRPPECENKCMSCRPCTAAVVVPVPEHRMKPFRRQDDEDSYYLLSWKCRCGNKIFHP